MFRSILLPWLVAVAAVISSPALTAEILEAITANSKLPSPRYYNPTVYDGQDSIYILGGQGTREILKYSISLDQVNVVGQMADTHFGSAVWVGKENILYFGGVNTSGSFKSEIWGLNTNNPSNMTVLSHLLEPSQYTRSVWDLEGNVYIVGGRRQYILDTILKYSTSSHQVEIAAVLPTGIIDPTLAWDDSTSKAVYIFGGYSSSGFTNEILKFDQVQKTVTKLNVSLPVPTAYSCTVRSGTDVYIIGGWTSGPNLYPIVRFDPSTNHIFQIQVKNFPERLDGVGCAYVEKLKRIYIFGGISDSKYRDEIMYINLGPEIPTTTTTVPPITTPVNCDDFLDGTRLSNPYCCESFYECENKVAVLRNCQQFLHFIPWTWKCEVPAQVGCGLSYQKPTD